MTIQASTVTKVERGVRAVVIEGVAWLTAGRLHHDRRAGQNPVALRRPEFLSNAG